MKINRTISSQHPEKCSMIVCGFFGNVLGRVEYYSFNPLENTKDNTPTYMVFKGNDVVGSCTDFHHACDDLLCTLGVIKNEFV